ncbi:MAG: hypothetical protein ACKVPX_10505 [Myxococcaceae bacterium]
MARIQPLQAFGLALFVLACPPDGIPVDGGQDGGNGDGGGGCATGFCIETIDSAPQGNLAASVPQHSVALKSDGTLGIAYFRNASGDNIDIMFVERSPSGVFGTPQTVRTVQERYGVALAYHPTNGRPVIAYLGGDQDGMPLADWFNTDAAISYWNGSAWVEQIVVNLSNEAPAPDAPNPASDSGRIVGLYPALAYNNAGTLYFAYRDVHVGQSVGPGDYNASDLELARGTPGGSWTRTCEMPGGNTDGAFGGFSQFVRNATGLALVSSRVISAATTGGTDVFISTNPSGTYPAHVQIHSVGDNQSGPSLAFTSTGNLYGLAVVEMAGGANQLIYKQSSNGTSWSAVDPVFQNGTGGWYPSLAFAPGTSEPHIAYHYCGPTLAQTSCLAIDDALVVARRTLANTWETRDVDTAGGFQPKLLFDSSGRRLLVYRNPSNGVLKLAVEQ